MSNYPPGVTGNEWQIAGGDEWEETRTVEHDCGEDGFVGEVTGTMLSNDRVLGNFVYDCPVCGQEVTEEDIELGVEPDPDRYRDEDPFDYYE